MKLIFRGRRLSSRRRHLTKAITSALVLYAFGVSQLQAAGQPIFHVSFDKNVVRADVAGGSPASPDLTEGLMLRMYKGRGDRGQGLYLSGGEKVRYQGTGNVCPQRGTISFWVAPMGWKASVKGPRPFVTFRMPRFKLTVGKIYAPTGFGIECTWDDAPTVSKSERACTVLADAEWTDGRWHRFDAAWSEKGLTFFVDGVARPARDIHGYMRTFSDIAFARRWKGLPLQAPAGSTITLGGMQKGETTAFDEIEIRDYPMTEAEARAAYTKYYKLGAGVPPIPPPHPPRTFDTVPYEAKVGVDHTVPDPWTPIVRKGALSFGVLMRTYEFGKGPFPMRVRVEGEDVLKDAPKLSFTGGPRSVAAGVASSDAIVWDEAKVAEAGADRVILTGRGRGNGASFGWRGELWFDGAYILALSMEEGRRKSEDRKKKEELSIEQLELSYTVPAAHSKYLLTNRVGPNGDVSVRWTNAYDRAFFSYPYRCETLVWLTGIRKGFLWWADSDANCVHRPGTRPIHLRRTQNGDCAVRIEYVNTPAKLTKKATWRFVLQATPTRIPPKDARRFYSGDNSMTPHENAFVFSWTTWHDGLSPQDQTHCASHWPRDFKAYGAELRRLHRHNNLKLFPYNMPGVLGDNEPEWDTKLEEWQRVPSRWAEGGKKGDDLTPYELECAWNPEIKGVALSQLGRHAGAKLTKRGLAAPEYAVRAMAPFIVHDVMPSHGKLDEMTVDRWWGVCEKVKLYAAASFRGYWQPGSALSSNPKIMASIYTWDTSSQPQPFASPCRYLLVACNYGHEAESGLIVPEGVDPAAEACELWSGKKLTAGEIPALKIGPGEFAAVGIKSHSSLVPFPCATPRVTVWHFRDQTDGHDDLVHKDECLYGYNEISNDVRAALVAVEDPLTGRGTAYLRLAPLPHARANPEAADFTFFGRPLPPDFKRRGFRIHDTGYPCVRIPYAGGAVGRTKALQDYQRTVRPYVSGRDGLFLSNTWGDRNRDTRIQEAFLLDEIKAAANLGVEVVQVDDGWQSGKSANSAFAKGKGVWNGYWAASPDFWVPDPKRFPRGLAYVTKAAAEKGINFGLWFGPDSSNDAANWERDADWLLKLHRTCGVNYYKLDSMKTTGAVSLERQRKLFDKVLSESQDRIVIDLDVTAERRPGYFGMMKAGPLFVENRYSDYTTYWPHLTLRALWSLAETIDPIRLRMEVLNPLRNREKYGDSPLAPAAYPAETLFAIVMAASPLGWFEIQNLAPETVAAWKPLVAAWKRERDAMAACNVIPVGAKPDGVSWMGFVFVPRDSGKPGYALFFRELSDAARFDFDFAQWFPRASGLTVLSPRGTADNKGVFVPAPRDFVWVRFAN